ncbi:MAG: outer membrane beta-barrel domain-containing protein [Anaeromyxobacter sp.]|nr:outer membrane beta-barrel domain-containing protein [Anaeromyxobacter sp.]MBL0276271.1 outer membrane beta-barrel domain-containing protein [Anaeromyxobacter sp.]
MRLRQIIPALIVALLAPLAGAQDLPGLDLSRPAAPAGEKAAPPTEVAPLSLEPEAVGASGSGAAGQKAGAIFGERDVALGDRVKAVQRKGFLKRGRFEVAPILALSVNDAFFQKVGGGLRLAYSLQDSFALAVRGSYYTPFRTDNVAAGKIGLSSQLLTSQLYGQAMLDGVWSPIYGKASFLADAIVHFDLYLAAGFGAVWSATSLAPRNEGPHLAAELGGGVRFYPYEWMAFELGLMATFYPDQPVLSVPATMQTVFVANVGLSFFFPTAFDYAYPQ